MLTTKDVLKKKGAVCSAVNIVVRRIIYAIIVAHPHPGS